MFKPLLDVSKSPYNASIVLEEASVNYFNFVERSVILVSVSLTPPS